MLRWIKIDAADLTLIAVLALAGLSQGIPQHSTLLTLIACALVAGFAIRAYAPKKKLKTEAPNTVVKSVPFEGVGLTYSNLVCLEKHHWIPKSISGANFDRVFIAAFNASRGLPSKPASHRSEFLDLTDALPDRCTVRIGMLEIRLEDGETSVKMKRDPRDPDVKQTVLLGIPGEFDSPSDLRKVN